MKFFIRPSSNAISGKLINLMLVEDIILDSNEVDKDSSNWKYSIRFYYHGFNGGFDYWEYEYQYQAQRAYMKIMRNYCELIGEKI